MTPPHPTPAARASAAPSVGGRGAGAAGAAERPAGRALLGVEPRQLGGVNQADPIRADRWQRALLDVPPQNDARHADLFRSLGDSQQPSFLHSCKGSHSARLLKGYQCCGYSARMSILETCDSSIGGSNGRASV
jgi:hypothetical protein